MSTAPLLSFTIRGQAASKANSREIVTNPKTKRAMVIKSKEARQFMADVLRQIPPVCRVRLQGPLYVRLKLYYRTERPDLDESVLLDAMQDVYRTLKLPGGGARRELVQPGCYVNDRQVRAKFVMHGIDARNPRAEVEIFSIAPTQDLFALAPAVEDLPF